MTTPRHHERVAALIRARQRRSLSLAGVIATFYAVVAAGCAFAPDLMARPVVGSHLSLGLVAMVAVMALGIGCSGYYTWWCNTVLDPLVRQAADSERTHER